MLERQAVEAPGPRPRSSATPRRESPNGTGPAADPEVGRGRLLVVDDSPENVALLARLLGSLGYEVCTAATGRQALEMVKAEPPGAVLMDVMMPDLSGLDALKALRADPATTDLPVILVSGLGDTQDIVEGLRLGANDYVTKPINPAVLHARLEVHAALKHARDSLRATADRLEAELARRSKDLRVARSVQRALLPSRVPRVEGIEAAWHYQPADEVGGDLYDLIALPDGKIFLFLADAMGHGVQAALVAASVQGIITAHVAEAGPDVDLSALMERLDGTVAELFTDRFVTAAAAVVDPIAGRVRSVLAGHPPILVQDATGIRELRSGGLPLGTVAGMGFPADEEAVAPGSLLWFFSDGLIEAPAEDGRQIGVAGLVARLATFGPGRPSDRIADALGLLRLDKPDPLADDLTILAVRVGGEGAAIS